MKIKILSIIFISGLLFAGCKNELEKPLVFDVSVEPGTGIQMGDTSVTAPKGTKIQFNFAGEPDLISFSYNRFNTTKSVLTFSTQPAWGTHIQNTLNVYLSDSFSGLVLNDAKADSTSIVNHGWTDITSQCNLPTTANTTNKASISLNDYRGKKATIAFRYKTEFAADWQPTWTISNLQVNDTVISTGLKTTTSLAATMGFSPFDLMNMSNPYVSADAAGVWNLTNTAAMIVKRSTAGSALNTDWLIMKPLDIAKGVNTLSSALPVKNTTDRVNSYSYLFTLAGEYTVTFTASNANYLHQESIERKVKIIITD